MQGVIRKKRHEDVFSGLWVSGYGLWGILRHNDELFLMINDEYIKETAHAEREPPLAIRIA